MQLNSVTELPSVTHKGMEPYVSVLCVLLLPQGSHDNSEVKNVGKISECECTRSE
jgi:hypothetical protein